MNFCVIPARGGSKRIPRKNIKDFLGKPVIGYTIQTLLKSKLFDLIIVSTDDDEIASISRQFGAEVPWIRPSDLSNDTATTDSVVENVLNEVSLTYGEFDSGCCVYPVNPLLDTEILKKGFSDLKNYKAASVFPVVRFGSPIEHALLLNKGRPCFLSPAAVAINSHDLPTYFHDAGMFYWFDVAKYRKHPFLFSGDSFAFEINQLYCQDVNTPEDWALAELKYIRLQKTKKL